MQSVKSGVTKLDRYPGTYDLLWNGARSKQTLIGGIIGLLFILATIGLIINKSINVFGRKQITLNSFNERDMSRIVLGDHQLALVMKWQHKIDDEYMIDILDPDDLPKYGINAYVLQIELNYSKKHDFSNLTLVEMSKCNRPGWQMFLCAPGIDYQPECSLQSFDTQSCKYIKQYHMMILPCNESYDDCADDVASGLLPQLLGFDTKFNIYEKNSDKIFQRAVTGFNRMPGGAFIYGNKLQTLRVPISKLDITLEESVMPRTLEVFEDTNVTTAYFYPTEFVRLDPTYHQLFPAYFDFYIYRSGFTEKYRRFYPRIDSMLGQIFGLMGLISLFFACLCSGYNGWLMEKYVKESINNAQQQQQYPQFYQQYQAESANKSRSYWAYLKQKLQPLLKCCRSQPRTQALVLMASQQQQRAYKQKQQQQQHEIDIVKMHVFMQQNKDQKTIINHMQEQMRLMRKQMNEMKINNSGKNKNNGNGNGSSNGINKNQDSSQGPRLKLNESVSRSDKQ